MEILSPIISLTPIYNTVKIDDPAILLPIANQIYYNPNKIFYDPYKTFEILYPNIPAYYVSYPDINDDIQIKREIYGDAWKKFKTSWIYNLVDIFKYIKKTGSTFRLVESLTEAENMKKNITSDVDEKIAWIINNFFTKSDIASCVEKYRRKYNEVNDINIGLWDVLSDKHIDRFRDFIYHQIKRKIYEQITGSRPSKSQSIDY